MAHAWPQLAVRGASDDLTEAAETLQPIIKSPDLAGSAAALTELGTAVITAFTEAYSGLFGQRRSVYTGALDEVRGRSEYVQVSKETSEDLLG